MNLHLCFLLDKDHWDFELGFLLITACDESSHSSSIRVDFEPNCDCVISTECGTLCHFTVDCLNSTVGSRRITDNNQITSILSDKADIDNRLCVNWNKFLKKWTDEDYYSYPNKRLYKS
jgi:hypothetical protein